MILLLSTADTDALAAGAADAPLRVTNPARLASSQVKGLLDGVDAVVLRLLGGRKAWPDGVAALERETAARGVPFVPLGGEDVVDGDLAASATVPPRVLAGALGYLVEGGPTNLALLARYLRHELGHDPRPAPAPVPVPTEGVLVGRERPDDRTRPTVGIVFYRAHALAGNTEFVDALADALDTAGANPLPVFCSSLRDPSPDLLDLLARCDALVVTVLAAGGSGPAATHASAGGDEDAWDVAALAALDVPVLQALCVTSSRAAWVASDAAVSPLDAAMQVAIPEFDGRLIGVPVSFKEVVSDVPRYVPDLERCARMAGIAVRHARLRSATGPAGTPGKGTAGTTSSSRRLAIVLSSYPTKHARVGNAVGLDTPASAVLLLRALAEAGWDVGPTLPDDGDALIHELIAAGGHDVEWLTAEQLARAEARVPAAAYRRWFAELPDAFRAAVLEHWGEPPGSLYVAPAASDDRGGRSEGDIVVATLRLGDVVLMIQPPRGFGENPIAIYHDPDLPPSHHYLAAYRWLDEVFGAKAVVHLGKHGTLEWLPGKGLGLSASCGPDAVLRDLPLVYPFIVNDPGEGTQAKRRAHAVVVDHLVPPMARADTYGDLAKLEQLLDEYATVVALDPDKAPDVRARIWDLVTVASLHEDLHVSQQPAADEFDEFVLHLDGWLCEVKDVQIRDGLHVLGVPPSGEALENLVLAVLRAPQVFGGSVALPGLRTAIADAVGLAGLGWSELRLLAEPGARVDDTGDGEARDVDAGALGAGGLAGALKLLAEAAAAPDAPHTTASDVVDLLELAAARLVNGIAEAGWDEAAADPVAARVLGPAPSDGRVVAVLRFACADLVPRLRRTTDELDHVVAALNGRFVPPGPSGSPTRGLVGVLPTGRNFYSVDPKAIPSRSAWDVGQALASSLINRHVADTGRYPASVGLTVWGTSAMRTQGDDIAEVLALLGVRPVWDDRSRRVTGLEVIPLAELGRPRIDVTVRISGFFRDAFPHAVALMDDAVTLVAALDEPADANFVRAHVDADLTSADVDPDARRRATTRIFGSKPGAYGAGLLPLIDAGNWTTGADLADVYATWGGFAYGRDLHGRPAREELGRTYARIQVAAKNQDTREHDIADSDDYFQYHGGMIAMVRQLTGTAPAAYLADSAMPHDVRTRTLAEETARVVRARALNPKWIAAMQRHGYKGAFELAATVDYLFGYDATAGVVQDWMYAGLAQAYVLDAAVREFLNRSNPWALRGITERLLEAADRGLWANPDVEVLAALRGQYLESEAELEGRA